MEKLLTISLQLNFTPVTFGCYGSKLSTYDFFANNKIIYNKQIFNMEAECQFRKPTAALAASRPSIKGEAWFGGDHCRNAAGGGAAGLPQATVPTTAANSFGISGYMA